MCSSPHIHNLTVSDNISGVVCQICSMVFNWGNPLKQMVHWRTRFGVVNSGDSGRQSFKIFRQRHRPGMKAKAQDAGSLINDSRRSGCFESSIDLLHSWLRTLTPGTAKASRSIANRRVATRVRLSSHLFLAFELLVTFSQLSAQIFAALDAWKYTLVSVCCEIERPVLPVMLEESDKKMYNIIWHAYYAAQVGAVNLPLQDQNPLHGWLIGVYNIVWIPESPFVKWSFGQNPALRYSYPEQEYLSGLRQKFRIWQTVFHWNPVQSFKLGRRDLVTSFPFLSGQELQEIWQMLVLVGTDRECPGQCWYMQLASVNFDTMLKDQAHADKLIWCLPGNYLAILKAFVLIVWRLHTLYSIQSM